MPIQATIDTGNIDKNDEPITANYWVVYDCSINYENKQANCTAFGYIKKNHYTGGKKIVAIRSFSWIGLSGINPFAFVKSGAIIGQFQTAIIAYQQQLPDGTYGPGEFSEGVVVDGN